MLFESPVRIKKVRNNVYAYQYRSGTIIINNSKYVMHSMTSAIALFRRQFPAYKK